ncbi:FAD-binding protein [Candidatus Ruthia endofausta]|uniref:FAD-binding protein n=1 Tax=Candidatus Ruthia endofausta TaxID=2738852 RepID=A0A6N0HNA4_9GAMM|nr:FAD-binding protein [Candidatus Ruthia endofausta]QKQ23803.1 FAD-binding protein [Candidatus Ruthia endofausta]
MSNRINQLQQLIKDTNNLHINSEWLAHTGVIEYFPEELVITIKAGTKISDIQTQLAKHNQTLPFFIKTVDMSIGAAYAHGAQDLSDCVLGVKIIDGTGEYLNFGGQVMKNVAGYDVARLLVGSKGKLAVITQISFKVMPISYMTQLSAPIKRAITSQLHQQIEQKLKQVFDPRGIFN